MRIYGDNFWVHVFNPPTGEHFKMKYMQNAGLHVAWNPKEFKASETKHGKED